MTPPTLGRFAPIAAALCLLASTSAPGMAAQTDQPEATAAASSYEFEKGVSIDVESSNGLASGISQVKWFHGHFPRGYIHRSDYSDDAKVISLHPAGCIWAKVTFGYPLGSLTVGPGGPAATLPQESTTMASMSAAVPAGGTTETTRARSAWPASAMSGHCSTRPRCGSALRTTSQTGRATAAYKRWCTEEAGQHAGQTPGEHDPLKPRSAYGTNVLGSSGSGAYSGCYDEVPFLRRACSKAMCFRCSRTRQASTSSTVIIASSTVNARGASLSSRYSSIRSSGMSSRQFWGSSSGAGPIIQTRAELRLCGAI